MPLRKKHDIGFNRRVRATWLTETLRLAASQVPNEEIEARLKDQIASDNQGKETIRKVFVYLNRVWLEPPAYCKALRDQALAMFCKRPDDDSAFLLNWGLCIAAYPFIGCVAEATGRLLRLQGIVQAGQVNIRLRERFGDRHFVHRSVRYNLSTFLESGALREGSPKGVYTRGRFMVPRTDEEMAWLVEALLLSHDDPHLPLRQIVAHSALFPVDMHNLAMATLKTNPRIEVFRHNLDEILISTKPLNLQPNTKA
jgi:hypothetical protein